MAAGQHGGGAPGLGPGPLLTVLIPASAASQHASPRTCPAPHLPRGAGRGLRKSIGGRLRRCRTSPYTGSSVPPAQRSCGSPSGLIREGLPQPGERSADRLVWTSMWITCAKRREPCAHAVEMLGIPPTGCTPISTFSWRKTTHTLCIARIPELSTRHTAIAYK